jgi:hypothetical protein
MYICLVGGLEHFFPFSWECHHPNWLIFFRGVETTNQNIYIYMHMYVHTEQLALAAGWWLCFQTSHLQKAGRWWQTGMLFVVVGNKTYVRHRSVDNYWSVNLESKNTIQWKIIRRFCQSNDAIVDSKVKGISTNYIVGIVATITSSNGGLNEKQFSLSDSHLGTLFWHGIKVSDIPSGSVYINIWHIHVAIPSDIFSCIYIDILSDIRSGIYILRCFLAYILTFFPAYYLASFWHSLWLFFWHSIWHLFWRPFFLAFYLTFP